MWPRIAPVVGRFRRLALVAFRPDYVRRLEVRQLETLGQHGVVREVQRTRTVIEV